MYYNVSEICIIPSMEFIARTSPEFRVAEGGTVDIICEEGYTYGNSGEQQNIVCSKSVNNFPASCRRKCCSKLLSFINHRSCWFMKLKALCYFFLSSHLFLAVVMFFQLLFMTELRIFKWDHMLMLCWTLPIG